MLQALGSIVIVLTCSLGCARLLLSTPEVTPCLSKPSNLPRISNECLASLSKEADYYQELNKALIKQNIFPNNLELIFSFRDGPDVESVCVFDYEQNPITGKLKRAIRKLARISPPNSLSCLSNHYAEFRFSFEFDSDETREFFEKGTLVVH
jgi:hypothetical protein